MTRLSTLYWRLALSFNGLDEGANCYILGLPLPDFAAFTNHSVRRPSNRGGQTRQGFAVATFTWNNALARTASILTDLITQAEASGGVGNGTVYFTTVDTNGVYPGNVYVDAHGIAHMPQYDPVEYAGGAAYNPVTLTVNNCTVDREPSNVEST